MQIGVYLIHIIKSKVMNLLMTLAVLPGLTSELLSLPALANLEMITWLLLGLRPMRKQKIMVQLKKLELLKL